MDVMTVAQIAQLTDLDALRRRGGRTALVGVDEQLSYAELAARVERRIAELGADRRVVALRATNTIDTIVTYLACLAGGHVASVRSSDGPDPFAAAAPADLHPDLAVLMSTSGSTGTAKSVRLSVRNVESNAASIADSLRLRDDDVAITSLPLHYCYGLSVVTSHLAVGASVVITDTSVVDPCFWDLVERHGVTTLSCVPFTFDLLDRLPTDPLAEVGSRSIRRVTQAGGRLAPEQVRHHALLGRRRGWDLYVMYGQTEATARMTVLDPDLAAEHPDSIGRPVRDGSIRLRPVPTDELPTELAAAARSGDVGEIVYRGPNVMLGYASSPADLALGREIDELATGDVGRFTSDGLLEIVGRRASFVKILGHRIDLAELEAQLERSATAVDRASGPERRVAVAGDDEHIVVAATGAQLDPVRRRLAELPIPASAIDVHGVDELPRLANGKIDRAAMLHWPRVGATTRPGGPTAHGSVALCDSVADIYASVLGVDDVVPSDSFTSLGGDSLSYVEVSLRLEAVLGTLPSGWHLATVADLARDVERDLAGGIDDRRDTDSGSGVGVADRWRRSTRQIDTSVVIRAVGICIIVGTHMGVARLTGGAHTLLAVAGYNFARFQLGAIDLPGRVRRGLATVARVAVPTSLWIGLQMALVGGYSAGSLFLVNNYFGSAWRRDGRWEYWYFEAFVQIFVVLTVLFALRPVRTLERRYPFGFVIAATIPAMVVGLEVIEFADGYNSIFRPHTTVWFVLLGWAAYRATERWQRSVVTVLVAGGSLLFFDRWQQAAMVTVLVGTLLWRPTVRLPRRLVPVVGVVAAASMITFLIHWQVWPIYTSVFVTEVAYVATMATGVGVWALGRRLVPTARLRELVGR